MVEFQGVIYDHSQAVRMDLYNAISAGHKFNFQQDLPFFKQFFQQNLHILLSNK